MTIPRGMIYQSVFDELKDFLKCFSMKNLKSASCTRLYTEQFKARLNVKYALPFPYARSALYHLLDSLSLDPESEIIMPPITIKPMLDVVLQKKLKPVFVDITDENFCFNIKQLESCINEKTKVILITYLFGIVPDLEPLISLLRSKNIFIIEDFSHALNAKYNGLALGSFGDYGIYSSSSLKTVDTYGGAVLVTNHTDAYLKIKSRVDKFTSPQSKWLRKKILINLLRNIFLQRLIFTFFTYPILRAVKYFSTNYYQKLAGARLNLKRDLNFKEEWNYHFTELQGNRGMQKLAEVDKEDKQRKANVYHIISALPKNIQESLPKDCSLKSHAFWQLPFFVADFEKFQQFLHGRGIDTCTTNLSLLSYLDIYPEHNTYTPVARKVKENYAFIPSYSRLSNSSIRRITAALLEYTSSDEKR